MTKFFRIPTLFSREIAQTPLHPSEARTKELIADRAEDVVVLADSSKENREVAAWAPLPNGWSWIDENGERTQSRKGA